MSEDKLYTLAEAHTEFAKQTNNRVWTLLGQAERSAEDVQEMIENAYASRYHWRFAGKEVHLQRGEWLLAHMFTVLGEARPALQHAERCLELTHAYPEQLADFDTAFAYEAIARALGLAGRLDEARESHAKAQAAGESIADPEDKAIFEGDFQSGEWFGVI